VWHTLILQKEFTDVEDALQVFDATPLLFPPGTSFHYSSFDVNLMSVVMQHAGERPFLKLIDVNVLQPLGLQDTFADRTIGSTTNLATFYERRGKTVKPWRDVNLSVKWAGGGFLSTPTDLVHLGSAWLDPQFISDTTRSIFWAPQLLANGDVNPQRYGLGWRSDSAEIEGVTYQRRHHGGVSKGSMNWLVVYPDERIVVDIAINARADEFSDFARHERRITALFLEAIASSPHIQSDIAQPTVFATARH
jgi:serine beta-lactamase-like protein LACTB